jgi:hypothetical protein
MMGKHRWKGELAKPIRIGSIPIETTEPTDHYLQAAIESEFAEKLNLLMDHYEITDKDDFFSLALALAIDHVPGFRVVPDTPLKLEHGNWGAVILANRGRRRAWTPERLNALIEAVEHTKKKLSISKDREALEILAQRGEWARPVNRSPQEWRKTLQNQLARARRQS